MGPHTKAIRCGHCNNTNIMKLVGSIEHLPDEETHTNTDEYGRKQEKILYSGYVYDFLECVSCLMPTIARYSWHELYDPGDAEYFDGLRYSEFVHPPNSEYSNFTNRRETATWFIDPDRILALQKMDNPNFDFSKLVQLCNEMNLCYQNNSLCALILLTRALIDHVPPIFQQTNFNGVESSYSGGKSFKDSMTHLNQSCRKIADMQIHGQIRQSEILPNKTQINFYNSLDVLLAEIIRICQT